MTTTPRGGVRNALDAHRNDWTKVLTIAGAFWLLVLAPPTALAFLIIWIAR